MKENICTQLITRTTGGRLLRLEDPETSPSVGRKLDPTKPLLVQKAIERIRAGEDSREDSAVRADVDAIDAFAHFGEVADVVADELRIMVVV